MDVVSAYELAASYERAPAMLTIAVSALRGSDVGGAGTVERVVLECTPTQRETRSWSQIALKRARSRRAGCT